MGEIFHRLDHRLLESRLRVLGVIHQVESIRNRARFKRFAITGRKGWAEFGLIGVCGFVQVNVQQDWLVNRSNQLHQRRRLTGLAAITKRAVGSTAFAFQRWMRS